MTHYYKNMDLFAVRLANAVIRWRWLVLMAMVALALGIGSGARHLEFASNSGNTSVAPELPVNDAYMKGFFSARYSETTSYDPNSPENYWARALGMNQGGTMTSNVSMFMNKYP